MYTVDLSGKVALITGGAGGIGRAIALALAQAGADVAVADLSLRQAQETQRLIRFHGRTCSAHAGDVTVDTDVRQLVEDVVNEHGGLHIVVNAAGIWIDGTLTIALDSQIAKLLSTNQLGPLRVARAAWPYLAMNGGLIVNIGSVQAHGVYVQPNLYNVTKVALEALTEGLAVEGGRRNIRAVCVAPGAMSGTGMSGAPPVIIDALRRTVPVGRRGLPEEIAHVVVMACAATYLSGTTITVDGGLSCERRPVTMLPPRLVADDPDVPKDEIDDPDA